MPPIDVTLQTPSIELFFEGLLALTTHRTPTAHPDGECKVHLLRELPPGHTLQVCVQQRTPGGWHNVVSYDRSTLKRNFSLNVEDAPDPDIHFPRGFFYDAVDLEGPDFYRRGVRGFESAGFRSTFTFNSGRFRVDEMSEDELIIRKGEDASPANRRPHRRVAIAIGVLIGLGAEGDAIFINEPDKITFKFAQAGQPCRIIVKQSDDPGTPSGDHAEYYHRAIGREETPNDKFHFHHELADSLSESAASERAAQSQDAERFDIDGCGEHALGRRFPPHAICFVVVLGEGPRD